MWQSAATDTVCPVDTLWEGSVLQNYRMIADTSAGGVQGAQYFVWTILFLIFFSLIFRSSCSVFLAWVGDFLRYPTKRTYSDTSSAVRLGMPVSLVILLPISAFLVYGTGAVSASYLLVLGVMAGYVVLRVLATSGISYVSHKNDMSTASNRMACVFFMIAVIAYSVIYLIGMFLPDVFRILTGKVVPVVSVVISVAYLIEQARIIFSFKEPVLLSILYLCTLEILPIVLSVATILKF